MVESSAEADLNHQKASVVAEVWMCILVNCCYPITFSKKDQTEKPVSVFLVTAWIIDGICPNLK